MLSCQVSSTCRLLPDGSRAMAEELIDILSAAGPPLISVSSIQSSVSAVVLLSQMIQALRDWAVKDQAFI